MYGELRAVCTALKNQLVYVFQDAYLLTLNNAYIGYATKSTLALLTHLYLNCTHISTTYMKDNYKKLRSPYNAEEPLEILFTRLNECAELPATAVDPFTDIQIF